MALALPARAHQTNAAFHRGAPRSGKELGYYSFIQIELLYAPRYVRSHPEAERASQPDATSLASEHRAHLLPCPLMKLPAQLVDATQALNLSAGVSNPKVLRGRSLSWRATLFR